ncbi:unnamed protein product, partial [marine sediment metagenome]
GGAMAIGADRNKIADHGRRIGDTEQFISDSRDAWSDVRERLVRIETKLEE